MRDPPVHEGSVVQVSYMCEIVAQAVSSPRVGEMCRGIAAEIMVEKESVALI